MAIDPPSEQTLKWDDVGAQFGAGFVQALQAKGIEKDIINVLLRKDGAGFALMMDLAVVAAEKLGNVLVQLEEPFLPVIAALVTPVLKAVFGAEVNQGDLSRRLTPGAGNPAAQSIVKNLLDAITGDTAGELQPSDVGARRIAAAAVTSALEAQFNAAAAEALSDMLPEGFGHFEAITQIPEEILRVLGVGRLVRRALTPFVNATCATPATWYVNKRFRPTLLGASTIAKQIARNPEEREYWIEQLERLGYSAVNIDALLNDEAKFLSLADARTLVRVGEWSEDEVKQLLADQGYDDGTITNTLLVEKLKEIHTFDVARADAAVDGYVAGRIDEGGLGGLLDGVTINATDKARYFELAASKRIAARRPLSSAEAATLVQDGILTFIDYRAALERENRTEDAIAALELGLRKKVDDRADVETLRKKQAEDRAAEKAKRDAAAAAKLAALEAQKALERRGTTGDLERAYVLGRIPIARVEDVYAAKFDADTVAILAATLEAKRQTYLEQQTKATQAAARAAARDVNVGELKTAVADGVLTMDAFRERLVTAQFSDEDVALLVATLQAELDDKAEQKQLHDAAAAAAKIKHIDLSTLEYLVRKGHRTIAQFDQTLQSLGFDDAARAALVEKLQTEIDDDAAAKKLRDAAAAKLQARGLSLEQFRRAVLLGAKSLDDYGAFLHDEGFTVDAVNTLVGELRADKVQADAAQQRRLDAGGHADGRAIPLSDLARAARLGLIPVQTYLDRLATDGYSSDDIAVEQDLLVTEIADVQATKAKRAAADAAAVNKGLSLEQTASAVKAHTLPIAVYTSTAIAAGYTPAAADVLTSLLQDELSALDAAAARKAALVAADATKALGLAQLEALTLAGAITLDEYIRRAVALGYGADDAELLAGLVRAKLDAHAGNVTRAAGVDAAHPATAATRADQAKGVVEGLRTIDDYTAWLQAAGYGPDDVDLLVGLVRFELDKRAPKGGA